jgi:Flp pilus assembly protein TadB
MGALVAGVLAGLVAALLPRPPAPVALPLPATRPSRAASATGATGADGADGADWMVRLRLPLSLLAGVGALVLVGGVPGLALAACAAACCWWVIGRAEPAAVRREREELRRELPHLARLLTAALSAGAAPAQAARTVAEALPGPGGRRLAGAAARLRLGVDPVAVWAGLADEPALAPLARALSRGQASGASVVASVERLGEELARAARADAEDRARRVGVKAAVPLGVCLLPAFLLIGIAPLVGGLLLSLRL